MMLLPLASFPAQVQSLRIFRCSCSDHRSTPLVSCTKRVYCCLANFEEGLSLFRSADIIVAFRSPAIVHPLLASQHIWVVSRQKCLSESAVRGSVQPGSHGAYAPMNRCTKPKPAAVGITRSSATIRPLSSLSIFRWL